MAKKVIKAVEFVKDVKDGFTDLELMQKYDLSSEDLHNVFHKLVAHGKISEGDLSLRNDDSTGDSDPDEMRGLPRNYPALSVTVHDGTKKHQKGVIRDITVEGIGVIGIEAEVGDKRTFVIDMGKLTDFESFEFEAECRWYNQTNLDGQCVAGFHITKISSPSRQKLTELIDGFTLRTDTVRLALS